MNFFKRLIVQPPLIYRALFPEAIWRLKIKGKKTAYITFDDGPVPESTPAILKILERYGVKATFFMVGDNARRNPALVEAVRAAGHTVGNHTMHHLRGRQTSRHRYLRDVSEANEILDSDLFRPPHGILRWKQAAIIKKHYNMVMYDVVTRDYARYITPQEVVSNVRRFTRNGSLIVFHDSERSARTTIAALPEALEWLIENGYELRTLGRN